MRLLYYTSDGELRWTKDFIGDDQIPPYAILSHTWQEGQEVTFNDLVNNKGKDKAGFDKIQFCARQAEHDGLRHFWIDTCCIDKSSSAELSESINSMFRWYRDAARCYAYLSDISTTSSTSIDVTFQKSRWFTRGWTLQELLAPASVQFFSKEGTLLGDKTSLVQEIVDITGITLQALQGSPLAHFSINERMSWAKGRETKREEDAAYSLLGLFDVQMPLIYGEGRVKAFKRLQKEIHESLAGITNAETAGNVHWIVPRTVNSLFTGRAELIDRIQNAFRVDESRYMTEQKRLVITGMGGQGKSEVCLKVASLMREDFWGVFWIDVGSLSTAKNGFVAATKALGRSTESIDESLQVLASTKRRWLLVLDNADDPEFDYATCIPSGTQGAVMMTSRIPQCSRYSTVEPEMLQSLNQEHSTQLLLKAARVPEALWLFYKPQVQDIVHLLESHTLALIQAGAYIAEGYCRLDQYPNKYRNQRKRLLKHYPEQERSRYRDVYATFEASADVLGRSKDRGGKDALALLAVLSVLHSSVLPLQIFEDAWKGARKVLQPKRKEMNEIDNLGQQHVSQLPELVGVQAEEWDDHCLKKASALLASLSLVTRHHSENFDGLSMHPLAHAWAKDRLEKEQQQQAWVTAGCLISLSRGQSEMWQMSERELRPHMQSFLSTASKVIFSYGIQEMILPIVLSCGWILDYMREDARLQSLLSDIYQEFRITPLAPSKEHLLIWELAARNLVNIGNARQAVALREHIVKVQETTLEETHPGRLLSQNSLAIAYQANGQVKKAVALLEHVVKVRETTLAENHPDRLSSQHDLAIAYRTSGQPKKAVTLLEHVVKVEETTLAETHPNRLISQNQLAITYQDDGQIKKAVALLEHVVKVQGTTLAETHPDRLNSQHSLAIAYKTDGQIKEAVALLEHVVKVHETMLTETHPDRLTSQHSLAIAYKTDGQTKEAVALLEHIVKIHETTLAETHPNRLTSQHWLANAYQVNGQIKKAVVLLEHVVKVEETTLEETHPDRLHSQHSLAIAYKTDGQIKEAVALLEHVVKVHETTLAETHPDRLTSQHSLASAYQINGQIKKAVVLLEHVVKVQETTLEETHSNRLHSQHSLAITYKADGQIREAVALLEHVVKVHETTLAETHPNRLTSQHWLANAYQVNGQIKEAVALLEHVVKVRETTLAENHPDRQASEQMLSSIQLC